MRDIDVAAIAADALETAEDVGEISFGETWRAVRTAVSPLAVARETAVFGAELAKIAVGKSDIGPERRDWRFSDDAWEQNAFYKRLGQSYLAMCRGIKGVVNEDADWRNRERTRFGLEVLTSALAPTARKIEMSEMVVSFSGCATWRVATTRRPPRPTPSAAAPASWLSAATMTARAPP